MRRREERIAGTWPPTGIVETPEKEEEITEEVTTTRRKGRKPEDVPEPDEEA